MARREFGEGEDLFLEFAQGNDDRRQAIDRPSGRRRTQRQHIKHNSFSGPATAQEPPAEAANRRPKSSGHALAGRPTAFETNAASPTHSGRHQTPNFQPSTQNSTLGLDRSPSNRRGRYNAPTRSPMSPSAPSRFAGRLQALEGSTSVERRPSLRARTEHLPAQAVDSADESPVDSSGQKPSIPESTSADSQTAVSTVWDELDDLKSRIKKLELTGRLPTTSGATISGGQGERPRTATTAPTTVDSSPKHERRLGPPSVAATPTAYEGSVSIPPKSHPLLYSALDQAKPLLDSSLFLLLEAAASDALQLASLTEGVGPGGVPFPAYPTANGTSGADRLVRRKVDSMCRNLTDLCLALCEGKHGPSSPNLSPATVRPPSTVSPSVHGYPRSNHHSLEARTANNDQPPSRLEARRTSIFGPNASQDYVSSPRGAAPENFTSDHDSIASYTPSVAPSIRAPMRARPRAAPLHSQELAGDNDTTIRPPSRAMTDVASFRRKSTGPRELSNLLLQQQQQHPTRSPSLRETLEARRKISLGVGPDAAAANVDVLQMRKLGDGSNSPQWEPSSAPLSRRRQVSVHGDTRSGDAPSRIASLNLRRRRFLEQQ